MGKILYFCVGCRKVHYNEDYNEKDGDLIINDWSVFLRSVDTVSDALRGKSTP